MRYLFFFALLSLWVSASADMYKWTDKNGKVIYSDKPNPNGSEEKVTGSPLTTYKTDPAVKRALRKPNTPTPNEIKKRNIYSDFTIEQPINDTALRQNAGNVTVTFAVKPKINTWRGDKIEVFIDGKKAGETNGLTYNLVSLDRGTHTLNAKLVNSRGKVLKSDSVTFHLLRASVR